MSNSKLPYEEMTCVMNSNRLLRNYRQSGYAVVENFVPDEEVRLIQDVYDKAIDSHLETLTEQTPQFWVVSRVSIRNPERIFPALLSTQTFQNAQELSSVLLGKSAKWNGSGEFLYKPPYDGECTAWHQDEGFMDPGYVYNRLTVWIALDPR